LFALVNSVLMSDLVNCPGVEAGSSVTVFPEAWVKKFLRLPGDRPFTSAEARALGVNYVDLRRFVEAGLLSHPIRGVYVSPALPEDLDLRIAILKLVVPKDCVVTDRTAGWLWGAGMILAPGDHLEVPRVSVFCPPGLRLRNGLSDSGERMFAPGDVVEVDGLLVTAPLRTACDLGRLLHRDQALAALDSMTALGAFTLDELAAATVRYKGYRGVIQLRTLVLVVDPRAQSPGESILRLRWLDTGLPRPQCQVEVERPWGAPYAIDIGLPELRFGGEYDGEEFHGPEQQEHDETRREWLATAGGWVIEVARKQHIHGPTQDIQLRLRRSYEEALRTSALR
jgi:hypothetical protein